MQYVDVKLHDRVATIILDRPETHNAINPRMMEDLRTALSDVHQEKRVQAVVLSGRGDHFCSGLDLKVFSEIGAMEQQDALPQWFSIWRQYTEVLEVMLRFPRPIVVAVDGAAIGAGLGLALAADMIVMSEKATLCAMAVRRGLVGGATTALLNFRFGASVAARMAMAGATIDAVEAYRLGMTVSQPVSSDQIWVAANEIAMQCADAPREAIQATKRVLNENIGEALIAQLSAGAADSATSCTTPSASEGIEAFVHKRDPNWPT